MERVRSMQLSRRNRHREEEWQHVLELALSSTSYAKKLMETNEMPTLNFHAVF